MKRSKPFIENHEDLEREHLRDAVYLQAEREEEEKRIMDEILQEERKLPAKIYVHSEVIKEYESKTNTLPF